LSFSCMIPVILAAEMNAKLEPILCCCNCMHLQEPIVCLLVVCLWQCGSCAIVVSCDGTVLTCWLLYDLCGILDSCNMIVCWIYQSFV
jgi:hypothetical protein